MQIDEETLSNEIFLLSNRKSDIEALEIASKGEIRRFCERLKGYTYEDWGNPEDKKDHAPLPKGFHALRVFDGRDGRMLGASWFLGTDSYRGGDGYSISPKPLTAHNVVAICICDFLEEVIAWRETRALPISEPGVLDLAVDLETRPRKLFYGGAPLNPKAVEWIARNAPRRFPAEK